MPTEEYLNLWELSNKHHDAVCDYLKKHGADELFKNAIKGKIWFLKTIAKEHNIDINK